jgi:hypothetical protein
MLRGNVILVHGARGKSHLINSLCEDQPRIVITTTIAHYPYAVASYRVPNSKEPPKELMSILEDPKLPNIFILNRMAGLIEHHQPWRDFLRKVKERGALVFLEELHNTEFTKKIVYCDMLTE